MLPLVHGRTIEVTGSDLLPISESLRVAPHIGRVASQFHLALLLPLLDAIKSIGSCVTFLVITNSDHHVRFRCLGESLERIPMPLSLHSRSILGATQFLNEISAFRLDMLVELSVVVRVVQVVVWRVNCALQESCLFQPLQLERLFNFITQVRD